MARTLKRIATVVAVVLLVSSCAASSGHADPPKPKGWQVIHYPDDSFLYTFCDHGNRLYVAPSSRSADGVAVAGNDPTCSDGAR